MASILSFSVLKPTITKASVSSSSSPTSTITTPSVPETLQEKFGRKGIKFSDAGDIVELTVRNGSSLKLQIPTAHVTSYRPKVYWKDDGFEEIVYTLPPAGPSSSSKGGIGLIMEEVPEPSPASKVRSLSMAASSLAPPAPKSTPWTVTDADSDSIDAVQVELGCTRGALDLTYVVSLYPVSMATAVIVKNTGQKPVTLKTAILSHFRFKSRAGTGIQGLIGASYCSHPPLSSPFEILSPSEAMKAEDPGFFSFGWEPEKKSGVWAVQDVPITVLRHKMSRVYAVPPAERSKGFYNTLPSKYETLDQGRELFFRVIRMGFDDVYVSSPGSISQKHGSDYFICTGPASVLIPVVVKPGEEWRGAQIIEHDNL
nr:photosynthetic NDH subunit of subcomplex B 2, chloroplastic [Ipomoea batatas]